MSPHILGLHIEKHARRFIAIEEGDGVADPVCDPTFSSWGLGGAVSPSTGSGAEPRKQTHFGNNLFKFGLKSGLWIAVYTPNSGAKKRFKIEDGEIDGT